MLRILIIEDDEEIRDLLERLLTREGYAVSAAANGKQGVVAFRADPFDMVITDIIMPEKDGIEAIMDLKRERPDLKLIAISGGGRADPENYLHSAQLLGANRTLRKPFTNDAILAAVKELFNQGPA
jgi:CheY-like chemotaxis protein